MKVNKREGWPVKSITDFFPRAKTLSAAEKEYAVQVHLNNFPKHLRCADPLAPAYNA